MKNLASFFQTKFSIALLLILVLTAVTFAPALNNDFINWDDPAYVVNNPSAHALTLENLGRIFSTYLLGNYQPLTILTFAVEYHFFGLDPFPYHLTNILLHILNIILVYIFICTLSGQRSTALLVSLLFAVHPTRVESVAWVTERKDVLFAFFYLFGLILYLNYLAVHKKNAKYLLYTFLAFVLSLLAKPAAVSFPLVLLCLDYIKSRRMTARSIAEKFPFFTLALAFGLIAVFGTFTPTNKPYPVVTTIQKSLDRTIVPLDKIDTTEEPFTAAQRSVITANALVRYGLKSLWPGTMSPYYPLPQPSPLGLPGHYWIALVPVGAILWLLKRSRNKTVRFGLLFFLSMIFLNLPMTRIGAVEIADRFTYLPFVGIFYLLALGYEQAVEYCKLKYPFGALILKAVFAVLVIHYTTQTNLYTRQWNNSGRLWSHVIRHYPNDPKGYWNRGNYFFERKVFVRARNDYSAALKLRPDDPKLLYNLGNAHLNLGRADLALACYDRALLLRPDYTLPAGNRLTALRLLNTRKIAP